MASGPEEIAIDIDGEVAVLPLWSVTWKIRPEVIPVAVGVPVITPLLDRERPDGNVPLVNAQEYGFVPLTATSDDEYAAPATPGWSDVVVTMGFPAPSLKVLTMADQLADPTSVPPAVTGFVLLTISSKMVMMLDWVIDSRTPKVTSRGAPPAGASARLPITSSALDASVDERTLGERDVPLAEVAMSGVTEETPGQPRAIIDLLPALRP
jgi:hypothetical protein